MRLIILLCSLILVSGLAQAKVKIDQAPYTLGTTINFKHEDGKAVLATRLWMPAPEDERKLPLLVVLDGQSFFPYAVSLHQMMQEYKWAPKFAILGIQMEQDRWPTYLRNRQSLIKQLSEQAFPFLESNYNVSNERILFGWEAAGGFTLRTLRDNSNLFRGYIAASPSPLYGDYFPHLKNDFAEMVTAFSTLPSDNFLFLGQGSYDYPQYQGIGELTTVLSEKQFPRLRWQFEEITGTNHESSAFETLRRGVQGYFYYFDKPRFASYEDFTHKGGFSYLTSYFEQQTALYRFDKETVEQNHFEALSEITFILMMEERSLAFINFLDALKDTDFLARAHMNHIYKYAEFFLNHQQNKMAKNLFAYLKDRHPDSARPIFGLSLIAKAEKDHALAKRLIEAAIVMAEKNKDFRLEEYQQAR